MSAHSKTSDQTLESSLERLWRRRFGVRGLRDRTLPRDLAKIENRRGDLQPDRCHKCYRWRMQKYSNRHDPDKRVSPETDQTHDLIEPICSTHRVFRGAIDHAFCNSIQRLRDGENQPKPKRAAQFAGAKEMQRERKRPRHFEE